MPSLLLHPDHRQWCPDDLEEFATRLIDIGFLNTNQVFDDPQAYHAGNRFLQLITFIGCSPQVALRPADARTGQEICSIHFRSFADIVFLASDPLPKARCPHCRASLKISMQEALALPSRCEHCANLLQRDMIDWRRAGGYGRFFVEVKGIFPHEAIPSEQLLDKLAVCSGCQWVYFYVDNRLALTGELR